MLVKQWDKNQVVEEEIKANRFAQKKKSVVCKQHFRNKGHGWGTKTKSETSICRTCQSRFLLLVTDEMRLKPRTPCK